MEEKRPRWKIKRNGKAVFSLDESPRWISTIEPPPIPRSPLIKFPGVLAEKSQAAPVPTAIGGEYMPR